MLIGQHGQKNMLTEINVIKLKELRINVKN